MSCEEIPRAIEPWQIRGVTNDPDDFDEALWMSMVMGISVGEVIQVMKQHEAEHMALGLPMPPPLKRGENGMWVGSMEIDPWTGPVVPAIQPGEHLAIETPDNDEESPVDLTGFLNAIYRNAERKNR